MEDQYLLYVSYMHLRDFALAWHNAAPSLRLAIHSSTAARNGNIDIDHGSWHYRRRRQAVYSGYHWEFHALRQRNVMRCSEKNKTLRFQKSECT